MVRLSVGLEHIDDILWDIDQALAAAAADARTAGVPSFSDPHEVVPSAVNAASSTALRCASGLDGGSTPEGARPRSSIAAGAGLIALVSGRVTDAGQIDRATLLDAMWMSMLAANLFAIGLLVLAAAAASGCASTIRVGAGQSACNLLLANVLGRPCCGPCSSTTSRRARNSGNWEIVATVGAYVLLLAAWRLWRRSRQHEALGADEAMALDPRPPILYLRSFQDDADSTIDETRRAWTRGWLKILRPPSPEEELAAIFERLGPVVAIGKPGEDLPGAGCSPPLRIARRLAGEGPGADADGGPRRHPGRLVARACCGRSSRRWRASRAGVSPSRCWGRAPSRRRSPSGSHRCWARRSKRRAPRPCQRHGRPGSSAIRAGASAAWWASAPMDRCTSCRCAEAGRSRVRDLAFLTIGRPSAPPLRKAWRDLLQATGHDVYDACAAIARTRGRARACPSGWAGAQWFYLGRRRRGIVYVCMLPIAHAAVVRRRAALPLGRPNRVRGTLVGAARGQAAHKIDPITDRTRTHEHLRPAPRPRPGELRGALAGELRRAQRRGLRRPAGGRPRRAPLHAGRRRAIARRAWPRRCARFGVGRGSTVSVMLPNTPEMVEAHYAVPALNAVLNTLNTRLDAPLLAWQMNHCEAAVLITDREFAPMMARGAARCCATPRPHAGRHRRRRQRVRRPGRAPRRARVRSAAGGARAAGARSTGRPTSGTRSPSATPAAPPATRRASSRTTAAPT